jgi:membrane-bound serine protease (ClpP class)
MKGNRGTSARWLARLLVCSAALGLLMTGGSAGAQTTPPNVVEIHLTGVVDPFVESYIDNAIKQAGDSKDEAVLLTIDTPGGLDSSMRKITQTILNAPLPVICYVSPQGARAASAGAFVLMSCPVAAMAPGTNVGAATPVGISGAIGSDKAVNDAAAYMTSLAEHWNRNAQVAETFVTQAASISAEQALAQNVIDAIAPNQDVLLTTIAGKQITLTNGTTVTLNTRNAVVTEKNMGAIASFFHGLLNPDLAFLFFWLGLALIVLELLLPGHIVSGVTGLILLILSIVSLGLLPVTILGILLLVLSAVFFAAEARHPGLGIWGILGLVALIAGGLYLFNGSDVQVSRVEIAIVAVGAAVFFGLVTAKAYQVRHMPPPIGKEAIIGREGVVQGAGLRPTGVVRVDAEQWKATSGTGNIARGERIVVTGIDGLVLSVEPAPAEPEAETAEGETAPSGSAGEGARG